MHLSLGTQLGQARRSLSRRRRVRSRQPTQYSSHGGVEKVPSSLLLQPTTALQRRCVCWVDIQHAKAPHPLSRHSSGYRTGVTACMCVGVRGVLVVLVVAFLVFASAWTETQAARVGLWLQYAVALPGKAKLNHTHLGRSRTV